MEPRSLVMFDYDGVIVDSLKIFSQSYIAACQENGLHDINNQQDVLSLFEHNVYESLLQRGVSPATIDNILVSYERRQEKKLKELKLFDKMAEALHLLAQKNKVFIITSNISSATESVMQDNGVDCIEEVIGAEKEKSKINKIKLIMARFGQLPAFYVGDTKGDMLEGKAAGAYSVGVSWGWHSTDKLKEGGADYIAYSPEELVDIITNSNVLHMQEI